MIVCPNKNLPEWKSLTSELGESRALLAFIRNRNSIPTTAQARELISNKDLLKKFTSLQAISEKSIVKELEMKGAITDLTTNKNGTTWYSLSPGDNSNLIQDITEQYGPIIMNDGDMIGINTEAVDEWNNLVNSLEAEDLTLQEINTRFLSNIGVGIEKSNRLQEELGVNAVADFSEMMVRIQEGKEEALTEEALHFFLEMIPQDMPELVEAMDKIMSTKTYKDIVASYSKRKEYQNADGTVRYDKIQKEAVAKELVTLLSSGEESVKDWITKLWKALKNWITGRKLATNSLDKIAQLYLDNDIASLNRNLPVSEVFFQLSEDEQKFYRAQPMNAIQKNIVEKIIAMSAPIVRNEETHTYEKISKLTPSSPETRTTISRSVTQALGSDFYSELESPEVIEEILNNFQPEYPGVSLLDEDAVVAKNIVDKIIEDIFSGVKTEKEIREILKDNIKVAEAIIAASEARRKTLFGTAIHDIIEAVIYDRPMSSIKVDGKIITEDMLKRLIYGSINQTGLIELLKSLKADGKILMTEVQMSNKLGNLAGEFDLVTIDKNGVVDIYDFKTKYLRPHKSNSMSLEEEFKVVTGLRASIGVKNDDVVLPELVNTVRTNMGKYIQQISLYKKMLMEAGIPVNSINIIGIPYRMKDGMITSIGGFIYPNLPFDERIGNTLFTELKEQYNISKQKEGKEEVDVRLQAVVKIPRVTLKKAFVKSLERLNELYTHFKETKSGKSLYKLLDESENSNTLARIRSLTQGTLDNLPLNTNLDDMIQFATVQKNFIEMIDGSSSIIQKVVDEFERLRTLVPQDEEAASRRLAEFGKIHNFLIGYQKMFDEINKTLGIVDPSNPIITEVAKLMGAINQVQSLYVETILPDIVKTLNSTFTPQLVANVKREYLEMIQAAIQRNDKTLEEKLRKEMTNLPDMKVLEETLKGQNGDVGWFFGKILATIQNPDMVVAGVAKRLKEALIKVGLINKEMRDRLSTQLESRVKTMGRHLNLKTFNESLVNRVKKIDPLTGKEREELVLKSEFSEELYYQQDKLKYELQKAEEGTDEAAIKEAKKKLKDFQIKYLQTERTEEFYRLHKILDKEVTHNGIVTTVDAVRKQITSQISTIQRVYHQDDAMSDEDVAAIEKLWEEYYQLFNVNNLDGTSKEGDQLVIAETLNQWSEISKKIYEDVEMVGMFEKRNNKMKLEFGENSETYKKWYAANTRTVVTEDYYTYINELYEELATLSNNPLSEEISAKYKELRNLIKAYKDKDGTVDGNRLPDDVRERVFQVEEEIKDLQIQSEEYELNSSGYTADEKKILSQQAYWKSIKDPGYDPDVVKQTILDKDIRLGNDPTLKEKLDRKKEIYEILRMMRTTETTKYYYQRLEEEERLFAEASGITYEELKNSKNHYADFRDSEWFQENHNIRVREVFDKKLGETVDVETFTPKYIWRKSTPVNVPGEAPFIVVKPARSYYKRVLKDSYINEEGKEVPLSRKDNKDIQMRLKPKTAEEYKAEYGEEHPYLDKDYQKLKQGYLKNTATQKERVDYENLVYLQNEMLKAQEGIELKSRLGLSIPFMDKTNFDRTIESGGLNVQDNIKSAISGLKRKFTRTENDMDNGILTPNSDYAKLATVDNDEMKFVPVKFTSKGDIADASYDVWGGVLNYVASINRKKELEKELTFIEGIEAILGDENNQPKSENKNLLVNSITKKYLPGIESKINIGGNVRLDVLKSFINSVMYNEEHFAGYDLMGVNSQKVVSQMMGIVSFTALGFAPFNWAVNMMSGQVQNMVETVGSRLFSMKDYMASKKEIYSKAGGRESIMADMTKDFSKVGNRSFWGQMMEVFDPIQGNTEKEFANGTRFHGVKNILKLGAYAGKVWGEWEIQTSTWLAFMKANKVIDGALVDRETYITQQLGDVTGMTIKEISSKKLEILKRFEASKVNLLDIMELNSKGVLAVKEEYKNVFQIGSKQFTDIVSKLHSLQKRINGSYAKFDKTYTEKTSLGRMMFFFRKYVIPLGLNRWGERRVDYEGMQIEEGFYRTFLRTIGKDLLKMRINVLWNWSNYSDKEKMDIRKTLTDIAVILTCVAITSFIMGYDKDDEDNMERLKERPWAYQALIFLLLKTKSETEQFIPIPAAGLAEISRILSSPSILFTNITQFLKLTQLAILQTLDLFPGIDYSRNLYYQKDGDIGDGALFLKDEGESKLFAGLMKTFVGYTGKTFSPADKIKDFEFTQR